MLQEKLKSLRASLDEIIAREYAVDEKNDTYRAVSERMEAAVLAMGRAVAEIEAATKPAPSAFISPRTETLVANVEVADEAARSARSMDDVMKYVERDLANLLGRELLKRFRPEARKTGRGTTQYAVRVDVVMPAQHRNAITSYGGDFSFSMSGGEGRYIAGCDCSLCRQNRGFKDFFYGGNYTADRFAAAMDKKIMESIRGKKATQIQDEITIEVSEGAKNSLLETKDLGLLKLPPPKVQQHNWAQFARKGKFKK